MDSFLRMWDTLSLRQKWHMVKTMSQEERVIVAAAIGGRATLTGIVASLNCMANPDLAKGCLPKSIGYYGKVYPSQWSD